MLIYFLSVLNPTSLTIMGNDYPLDPQNKILSKCILPIHFVSISFGIVHLLFNEIGNMKSRKYF